MLIKGKVVHGKKRGRLLGYRTANILLTSPPSSGIYISTVRLQMKNYPAVSFVGNATTFGDSDIFLESHILDFERNIYDKWIKVRLIQKIRENAKFKDVPTLVAQMKEDVSVARRYFSL